MTQLTESYLESLGFSVSWTKEHKYHTQYTKHDDNIENAIMLISQTSVVDSIRMDETPEVFEVWFWGKTPEGNYGEVNSCMLVSSVEELETILSCLKY